jgi:recombination protein RecT
MAEQALVKQEPTMAERFTSKVLTEFQSSTGSAIALTNFQKRLAQNYFIAADMALKVAEEKRKKKRQNQDPIPVIWANIDMEALSQSVVSAARIGWDPMQNNHVSLIPFKNNATGKYGITFMPGYRGIELKSTKYGLDIPDYVIVELVYTNDKFKSIKKDQNNPVEGFTFEIVDDFDRGEIRGGFYYHGFNDIPSKNKLVVFSKKDIEKRKPRYASAEFWGGMKDVWENGKKVGQEESEGWYEKMCYKTIYRAAYNDITIDSQKIDDDYLKLKQSENEYKEAEVQQTIAENGNKTVIDITPPEDENKPDQSPPEDEQPGQNDSPKEDPQHEQMALDGPEF